MLGEPFLQGNVLLDRPQEPAKQEQMLPGADTLGQPSLLADEQFLRERPALALFCFEPPGSEVASLVEPLVDALARRGLAIHLFVRRGFPVATVGVTIHVLGECQELDLLGQVQEFGHRACNAFLKLFPSPSAQVSLMGFDWSSIPPMTLLRGIRNHGMLLCLHSLERQRSDMSDEMSSRIEEIEMMGLRSARTVLARHAGVAECARNLWSGCSERVIEMPEPFCVEDFETGVDPGGVKARYQIGPVDPTILYVGDLNERCGPDLLIKAMPGVLKRHPQARLIVAGHGDMYWPLRVYARYLLLDYAVRLPGHVDGGELSELVQAADIVAVPSRDTASTWPVLAAWAAHRPVVATHEAAPNLLVHDQDSLLVFPTVDSCAWGIGYLLSDPERGRALAANGRAKLEARFGWNAIAAQICESMAHRVKVDDCRY